MQIVIELSDKTYKDIKEENGIYGINNGLSARITGKVVGAIQSGTPLPKGHGDLIDKGDLLADSYCIDDWSGNEVNIVDAITIKMADTIIKADKAESEEV